MLVINDADEDGANASACQTEARYEQMQMTEKEYKPDLMVVVG
jgi:hypothetical protein